MVVAAVIDGWKLKVPNWLTFPLVLSGWALGLCHDMGWLEGTGEGGFGASLAGTAIGFVITCGWTGLAVSSSIIGAIAGGDPQRLKKALLVIPGSAVLMVGVNLIIRATMQ